MSEVRTTRSGIVPALVIATRELGKRDLEAIKAVRKKRAAGGGEP